MVARSPDALLVLDPATLERWRRIRSGVVSERGAPSSRRLGFGGGLVQVGLAARERHAVVARHHNHRVLGAAGVVEHAQDLFEAAVESLDLEIVVEDVAAHLRRVRRKRGTATSSSHAGGRGDGDPADSVYGGGRRFGAPMDVLRLRNRGLGLPVLRRRASARAEHRLRQEGRSRPPRHRGPRAIAPRYATRRGVSRSGTRKPGGEALESLAGAPDARWRRNRAWIQGRSRVGSAARVPVQLFQETAPLPRFLFSPPPVLSLMRSKGTRSRSSSLPGGGTRVTEVSHGVFPQGATGGRQPAPRARCFRSFQRGLSLASRRSHASWTSSVGRRVWSARSRDSRAEAIRRSSS